MKEDDGALFDVSSCILYSDRVCIVLDAAAAAAALSEVGGQRTMTRSSNK